MPKPRLWFPGGVGIGRNASGAYMAVAVGSPVGWDFPTLRGMFPASFSPERLGTFEARLGHTGPESQGYALFKVRSGGKWSKPLPLRTLLTGKEIGFAENPRQRSKYSRRARTYVGRKITRLAREGYTGKQRTAIALSMARRRGLTVPKRARRNPLTSETQNLKGIIGRLTKAASYLGRGGWDTERDRARADSAIVGIADAVGLAEQLAVQVAQGFHRNPTLAIVGAANPPGRLLGEIVGDVKYHRTTGKYPGYYKHGFKGRSKACIYAMPDGTLRIIGKGR